MFKYLLQLETPEAKFRLYKQVQIFFPVVSNNSLIIILKLLFSQRTTATCHLPTDLVAICMRCGMYSAVVLAPLSCHAHPNTLNKVATGVPSVWCTKRRFFFCLALPPYFLVAECLLLPLPHLQNWGLLLSFCRCRRQNLCGFQQPGVLHLAVAAG